MIQSMHVSMASMRRMNQVDSNGLNQCLIHFFRAFSLECTMSMLHLCILSSQDDVYFLFLHTVGPDVRCFPLLTLHVSGVLL